MRRAAALMALAAGLSAVPAGAQCVMCFRTAKAQNQARARVLNTGIVLLGGPPFVILAGFAWFVASKNRKFRD